LSYRHCLKSEPDWRQPTGGSLGGSRVHPGLEPATPTGLALLTLIVVTRACNLCRSQGRTDPPARQTRSTSISLFGPFLSPGAVVAPRVSRPSNHQLVAPVGQSVAAGAYGRTTRPSSGASWTTQFRRMLMDRHAASCTDGRETSSLREGSAATMSCPQRALQPFAGTGAAYAGPIMKAMPDAAALLLRDSHHGSVPHTQT
jgi:hypothetical protein